MSLTDLFIGTDFFNRLGRRNIRGDELADMIGATRASAQLGGPYPLGTSGGPYPTGSVLIDFSPPAGGGINFDDGGFIDFSKNVAGFVIPDGVTRFQCTIVGRWFPQVASTTQVGFKISYPSVAADIARAEWVASSDPNGTSGSLTSPVVEINPAGAQHVVFQTVVRGASGVQTLSECWASITAH